MTKIEQIKKLLSELLSENSNPDKSSISNEQYDVLYEAHRVLIELIVSNR